MPAPAQATLGPDRKGSVVPSVLPQPGSVVSLTASAAMAHAELAEMRATLARVKDEMDDRIAEQVAEQNAERDAIIAGKHVFAGPLSDRDGNEKVAAGEVLGDGDLWGMDWFVEGVTGQ